MHGLLSLLNSGGLETTFPLLKANLISKALSSSGSAIRGLYLIWNSLTNWFALYSYRNTTLS